MKLKIIIAVLFPFGCFCQLANYDTLGEVSEIPMMAGYALKLIPSTHYDGYGDGDFHSVLSIISGSDTVFSINEATVAAVFDIGDELGIVTRDESGRFYCYKNLSKSFVERNNELEPGTLIGLARFDEEKQKPNLEIMMSQNDRYLTEDKIWNLINACDKSMLQFQ